MIRVLIILAALVTTAISAQPAAASVRTDAHRHWEAQQHYAEQHYLEVKLENVTITNYQL